jgi:hypothetical protein
MDHGAADAMGVRASPLPFIPYSYYLSIPPPPFYTTTTPSTTHKTNTLTPLPSGTAPLSGTGHINISPKGGRAYGILSPTKFWYMDLTGSGVETHAHLYEPGNARICIMLMAFEGPPKIVRLWGKGVPLENGTQEFEAFVRENTVKVGPGSRSVIVVDVRASSALSAMLISVL